MIGHGVRESRRLIKRKTSVDTHREQSAESSENSFLSFSGGKVATEARTKRKGECERKVRIEGVSEEKKKKQEQPRPDFDKKEKGINSKQREMQGNAKMQCKDANTAVFVRSTCILKRQKVEPWIFCGRNEKSIRREAARAEPERVCE